MIILAAFSYSDLFVGIKQNHLERMPAFDRGCVKTQQKFFARKIRGLKPLPSM
jgi:hypothetical protein